MADERAEILIQMRALVEPVRAAVMRRLHRHVLQMTMTTFFADRAVVRMVGHQKLDDRRAAILRLFVGDRNESAVRCRRTARHDYAARLVALSARRLDRTPTSSPAAAEPRVE